MILTYNNCFLLTKSTQELVTPLSKLSTAVNGLKSVSQIRIYVTEQDRKDAERAIDAMRMP
jgi:hypothetical protein